MISKYLLRVIFSLLIFNNQSIVAEIFYVDHAQGWHWYNNKEEVENLANKENPSKQMSALKATIQQALDKAVLYPTDENIKNYIVLQNKISNQSSAFANIWQKVLLENPDLNYALVHPTNTLGKQVDLDMQRKKEDNAIAKLAQESGLFFFYSSSCGYCRKFAPIVKSFAKSYNMAIIPITTDGIALPEFPNSRVNQGQAAKFKVMVEPSLFAVNPYTQKAYPVSQGLISESDLRARILDITQNFTGVT